MDKLPKGKQGDEVWLPNTTPREAVHWANARLQAAMLFLISAHETKDVERIDGVLKEFRHIVTRLDAYRRQCVREWNAQRGVTNESENRSDT